MQVYIPLDFITKLRPYPYPINKHITVYDICSSHLIILAPPENNEHAAQRTPFTWNKTFVFLGTFPGAHFRPPHSPSVSVRTEHCLWENKRAHEFTPGCLLGVCVCVLLRHKWRWGVWHWSAYSQNAFIAFIIVELVLDGCCVCSS